MKLADTYRLSGYQDYGPLGEKDHIHLVREKSSGKICVKKLLDKSLRDVIDFRTKTTSPYFPKIGDVIEEENAFIVIEEYVEGITLEDYMMGSPLPENEAVELARQICHALQCLHEHSPMIIYRDLKSENIMITPQKEIRLIDFHISRQYQEGKRRDTVLLGTAEYAAPEQFGYFQTDNRTDIYAFGVLFNYMLTGKFPIEYITEGKYAGMIRKCVELEPAKRYQRVEEIRQELLPPPPPDVPEVIPSPKYSWAIPGFRSNKPWKMITAILGYTFILYMGLSLNLVRSNGIPYSPHHLWINRILFTASQIITIFFAANYRGFSDKIKFLQSPSKPVRILRCLIAWFVFLFLAATLTVTLEKLFP